jgi:hypothetical protein
MSKILQFLTTLIGFAAFGFIFYLVFRPDQRMMIRIGAVIGAIILLVLLFGLIGRIKDRAEEKRRKKPYKPKT